MSNKPSGIWQLIEIPGNDGDILSLGYWQLGRASDPFEYDRLTWVESRRYTPEQRGEAIDQLNLFRRHIYII